MKKDVIGVAVIAAGSRSRYVVKNLLRDGEKVRIKAVFDPDKALAADTAKFWGQDDIRVCETYQDAINTPGVEWVMVFSPNAFHKEHILAAFNAGKHVFSEKPLATKIEDCKTIFDAHQKSGVFFATGFVLRYAPIYRKAKELIDEGKIGKILSIDANENISPEHGSYIMMNWRRFTELAGPHILEKCCHDLDLINWFTGSIPSKVAAFGGLDLFVPSNKSYVEKFKNKDRKSVFTGWQDPHSESCPFESKKDLMDNLVGVMEFRNKIRVQFQATMSNAIPERRMYFSGTEGTMVVELYSSTLQVKRLGEEAMQIYDFHGDGHGGGDDYIMKELYDTMLNGVEPKCSGNEGLESAVSALALDRAAQQHQVIDLEPVWKSLGR
jgi:predicted dehydrogenase